MDGIQNIEVFPIDSEFRLWKLAISNIWESDYRSWMDVGSDQRSSRHENNSQS